MSAQPQRGRWRYRLRRLVFGILVLGSTLAAMALLLSVFQTDGLTPLELILLLLYAALFLWICTSFWTAALGFLVLLLHPRRRTLPGAGADHPLPPTALVMPVYNEDPVRVFAGLRAICRSLEEEGEHRHFDVFILSDTRDPDTWIEEERAWYRLCSETRGHGHIFYRNRAENVARKSGNIADFCRRWGGRYRYMIVLDADSTMSAATLVQMVRMMEVNPGTALIQAPPLPVNRESLFARIQQFAASAYGPVFNAGLGFWQARDSNFWGHNAIIRMEAFARHCGLPKLPGGPPFGGEILSHDFVEAALLHRAGWEVWLAPELGGSFEEIPPTLIDYAKRDRRWCQGNLQHLQLVFARGFRGISRLHFAMGVMSYLSSPLWLIFLIFTGIEAYVRVSAEPVYFLRESLEPIWPVSYAVQMTTVLGITLAMLFLPKIFALLLLLTSGARRRAHGGMLRASASALLETVFSVLIAPVLMLFQSRFVWAVLFRRNVGWPPQRRADHRTGLIEAILTHGVQTALGVAVGVLAYRYVPTFFWWSTPVLLGLVVSIPLSMLSSRSDLGRRARRAGLFLTPPETHPPRVLTLLRQYHASGQREAARSGPQAFPAAASALQRPSTLAMRDPQLNALHATMLSPQPRTRRRRHYLEGLLLQVLDEGPDSLDAAELRALLSDRDSMLDLHTLLWAQTGAPG